MYISKGNDRLSCKLFPRDPASKLFRLPVAANKTKRLQVADLFDIRQDKGESLKSYLARTSEGGTRRPQSAQRRLERQVETSHPEKPVMMLNARREEGREIDHHREGTPDTGVSTIFGGRASVARMDGSRKRKACNILAVQGKANITPTLVITFSKRDMSYEPPRQDEPMVISVVMTEYKVEKVLINQGSSANILYWSTCKRLGL
ncbi:hypothetical protein CR513_35953, partial [Mucuna pruriens]